MIRAGSRALIIDQCTSFPVTVCRALARRGCRVDVFAEPGAGVVRSRYLDRALRSPPWTAGPAFVAHLDAVVESGDYEAIYLCSELACRRRHFMQRVTFQMTRLFAVGNIFGGLIRHLEMRVPLQA